MQPVGAKVPALHPSFLLSVYDEQTIVKPVHPQSLLERVSGTPNVYILKTIPLDEGVSTSA